MHDEKVKGILLDLLSLDQSLSKEAEEKTEELGRIKRRHAEELALLEGQLKALEEESQRASLLPACDACLTIEANSKTALEAMDALYKQEGHRWVKTLVDAWVAE